MFGIAERKFDINRTGTNEILGPGAYTTCPTKHCRNEYEAICGPKVPFLSRTPRKTVTVKPGSQVYYDVKDNPKIKLGCSPSYTEERDTFYDPRWDNPAPTDYDPKIQAKKCKPVVRKPGIGNLLLFKVPLGYGLNAPTIPTDIDENGYDIGPDKELIKIPPNEYDRSLGPAFYDVPRGELCYTTKKYSGVVWYKMAERKSLVSGDGPGPTDYHVKYTMCAKRKEDEALKEMKRKNANIPRSYTEQQMKLAARENIPGPGHYEIQYEHKKLDSCYPKPFICGAERMKIRDSDIPLPGYYSPCDCYKHRQEFNISKVGFNSNLNRFKYDTDDTLGPAWYDKKEPKCVFYKADCGDVPFDSKATRWPGNKNKNPAPGEYDVEKKIESGKADAYIFKSVVPRFKHRPREKTPPRMDGRSTWPVIVKRKPRKLLNYVFMSTLDRGKEFISKNPGPGKYDVKDEECRFTGFIIPESPRFKKPTNDTPPPGQYNVKGFSVDSMYRTVYTQNTIIQKELDRLKPKKRVIKKKKHMTSLTGKQLRWFARPTREYIHCF